MARDTIAGVLIECVHGDIVRQPGVENLAMHDAALAAAIRGASDG